MEIRVIIFGFRGPHLLRLGHSIQVSARFAAFKNFTGRNSPELRDLIP
jgi:hypothetical protein